MPRRPAIVTQADVARAVRAIESTGGRARVVFEDGRVIVEKAPEREQHKAEREDRDEDGAMVL